MVEIHFWKKDSSVVFLLNFHVKYAYCSKRPITKTVDEIITYIEQNQHLGSPDVVQGLNIY